MRRRTTRVLPVAVVAAAVLLAGCSSSTEAAKLATEVARPLRTPATVPPESPADEPGEVAASDELPETSPERLVPPRPRRGGGFATPPGDPLAGVDTSEASAEQAGEIDDRVVTLDEYHAAFERFRACMDAAGFEIGNGHFYDGSYHYTVPSEAVDAGADEECYRAELYLVDLLRVPPLPDPSD
jgi:uncharacterized lipoprotein